MLRPAVDAQRLAQPRHEKDQPDPGPRQQVADRVDPVVAEPVGDQQGLVVEHLDKARRVALWRGIAAARRIGRGDDEKRRARDKGARMLFEPGSCFLTARSLGAPYISRISPRSSMMSTLASCQCASLCTTAQKLQHERALVQSSQAEKRAEWLSWLRREERPRRRPCRAADDRQRGQAQQPQPRADGRDRRDRRQLRGRCGSCGS